MSLPRIPSLEAIARRLPEIFPDGTEHRGYVTRDIAVKTVYVMLYAGAIEGSDRWIRPSHVYFMTEEQAGETTDTAREEWYQQSVKPRFRPAGTHRWYADNSREPIRDETIRFGLIPLGAIVERPGVATTASTPKYALEGDFAALFDEGVTGDELNSRIEIWRKTHLSKGAVARLALVKKGAVLAKDQVPVTFPNGETRNLSPGPSSVISKEVIETFAPRFLRKPAVLWLSESRNKVVARDDELANTLGLKIDASRNLPDIILVDLDNDGDGVLLVFIEVVATDGAIDSIKKKAFREVATSAGFSDDHLAYLTVFADRSAAPHKKLVDKLAWGSFVWFASEPDNIVVPREGHEKLLSQLR